MTMATLGSATAEYGIRHADEQGRQWPAFACPHDGNSLTEERDHLICAAGHRFPIVAGIPRFVPATTYADHFGEQWKRYRLTQLDSYTGVPISRDRLRRCFGERLWNNLEGQNVLECGCGAGRFTENLLDRGARVTSIDLSEAVEANIENFPIGNTICTCSKRNIITKLFILANRV